MTDVLGRRGEEICRWILLVLYVGANLLFSTQTANIVLIKDLFAPFCALLLLLVWMTGEVAATGRWSARRSPLHLPLAFLFVFLAYSAATSPSSYESVEEYVRFFANFLILLALPKFLTDRAWLARILSAVGWVALASTLYGLSQWADADLLALAGEFLPADWGFPGWGQGVFISTHGNPNFYSGYLVATIPILLGMWACSRSPTVLLGFPFLLAAMILSVVKAEARGAYLGLGAALAVFAGVAFLRRRVAVEADPDARSLRRTGAGIVLGCALFTALLRPDVAMRPLQTVRDNAVSLLQPETSYTNAVRLILWQTWLDGWEREPWLGRGLGVSNVRMPMSRPNWYHHGGVAHNSDHAHNEWFEWMMEGGVFGASLYVWLNLVLFAAWIRTLRARWRDADLPILLGAGLGLLSQLVQSCFDPETRWTGNAITNHFSAGLMIAWANLPAPGDERPRVPWDGATRAQSDAETGRRATGLLAAATAAMLFFFYGSIRVWRADHHYRNASNLTGGEITPRHLAAAGMEGAAAAAYNPYHLTNLYSLALIRMTHGDAAGTLRVLAHLQALAPDYVQIHQLLASAKEETGRRAGAAWERDRETVIEDSVDNHLAAAQAWALLGRAERAAPHLHHALAIERDDAEGSRTVLFYRHDVARKALETIEP